MWIVPVWSPASARNSSSPAPSDASAWLASGEDAAGVGQPAAAAVSLDETLPGGGLQQP